MKIESKLRETPIKSLIHFLINRREKSPIRSARHIIEAAEKLYHSSVLAQKKEALTKELSCLIEEKNEPKIMEFIHSHFKK